MRSKWKGIYSDTIFFKTAKEVDYIESTNEEVGHIDFFLWTRRSTLLYRFRGITVNVYNGKNFLSVKIKKQMEGHKLGEFATTKITGQNMHTRNIGKKKKKRKK